MRLTKALPVIRRPLFWGECLYKLFRPFYIAIYTPKNMHSTKFGGSKKALLQNWVGRKKANLQYLVGRKKTLLQNFVVRKNTLLKILAAVLQIVAGRSTNFGWLFYKFWLAILQILAGRSRILPGRSTTLG